VKVELRQDSARLDLKGDEEDGSGMGGLARVWLRLAIFTMMPVIGMWMICQHVLTSMPIMMLILCCWCCCWSS
jgi:hypothetical protein